MRSVYSLPLDANTTSEFAYADAFSRSHAYPPLSYIRRMKALSKSKRATIEDE